MISVDYSRAVLKVDYKNYPWYLSAMAGRKPPDNENPPKCACGCNESVGWSPGHGWGRWVKGHHRRGQSSFGGKKHTAETRARMSEAAIRRYARKRRRDIELEPGPGVYSTHEYREARQQLVIGNPCSKCGSTDDVCSHHEHPGDDSSLVPLCRKCHPTAHGKLGKPRLPPEGQEPPECGCGCGQRVGWCAGRGWSRYRPGHVNLKVSGSERYRDPPLCACGCGQQTTYKAGVGWNEYRRGHRARVELRSGSRLTDADVEQIRRMSSENIPQKDIAAQFGISQAYVSQIVTGYRRGYR